MAGGKGDDRYYIDSFNDKVTELAKQGFDAIYTSIDIDLVTSGIANIESLVLLGTNSLDAAGDDGANVIYGNDSFNELSGRGGNDRLTGAGGNDVLVGGTGDDFLDGGDGNDRLYGENGNDTLDGGNGTDTMTGGSGNDLYVVNIGSDVAVEDADGGIDEIRSSVSWFLGAVANVENLTLTGTGNINGYGTTVGNVITGNSGDNSLLGGDGNDVLSGGLGDDALDGGTGNDKMVGGKGNDVYFIDSLKDVVVEKSKEGDDYVFSTISYVLGNNLEHLTLTSAGDVNGIGNALGNVITGYIGKNKLDGKAGNDVLTGDAGNDLLLGGTGDDILYGGADNDTLRGGAGQDELTGGAGDDLLLGETGSDLLDGGTGNDDMRGGQGDDVYRVDSVDDKVTELKGQGIDRIDVGFTYDLATANGANVEKLFLDGSGDIDGFGNGLNNVILGNNGKNLLNGHGGDDTLLAGSGEAILIGETGNDVLFASQKDDKLDGGDGNDVLQGNGGADTLIGGRGNDWYIEVDATDTLVEDVNGGIDKISAAMNYTLGANFENLTLLGGANYEGKGNELANIIVGNTGNNYLQGLAGNDVLTGGDGSDVLIGGTGNDKMVGGADNDAYYVDSAGDKVIENVHGGDHDIVITTLASYVLGANVEDLSFYTLTTDSVGIGNVLANMIDGDAGNDNLDGKAGNDTLRGWGGNDQLTGGDGNDLLVGEIGNDTLTGGAGRDELNGGSGDDVMTGGKGDDTYIVDSVGDVVQEAANSGYDTIITTVSLTLGANIESVQMDALALSINGNDLNNAIYGSNGSDTANGGKGHDYLYGAGGADVLNGGDGNDVIEGGFGADTIDGGAGDDHIRYDLADPSDLGMLGADLITGFEVGKDKIDLRDLFEDFGIAADDVVGDGYLYLQVSGGNTNLLFDSDGGADSFVTLVTLQNVTNASLADVILE
ncbi:MAG TPA: calcium-binding protein [Dongiaceae bacterium]|nr:calcium-binding protein [Dongiaceae bacterium]